MAKLTDKQISARLYWVEAMLSGKYRFGKCALYNHVRDTHSAIGVAMASDNWPRNANGYFVDCKELGWKNDRQWFDATFGSQTVGSTTDADIYVSLSHVGNSYLPVAMLVLESVPDTNRRKAIIRRKLKEEAGVVQKTRV